jgi:hypothetical protein
MLTLLITALVSQTPAPPARGTNGPVEGTHCSGAPEECKVSGATCSTESGTPTWPAPKEGPACGCVKNVCHYVWIEQVACVKDADCELRTEPVVHVVKATSKKKQKKFRPCKDGTREAICDPEAKICAVRAWRC